MISSADVGTKLKGTSVANEIARTCARARSTEEFAWPGVSDESRWSLVGISRG